GRPRRAATSATSVPRATAGSTRAVSLPRIARRSGPRARRGLRSPPGGRAVCPSRGDPDATVERARDEATVTGLGLDLAAVIHERPARERVSDARARRLAFVQVVVDVHERGGPAVGTWCRRVEDDDVGVVARCNGPLV